MRKNKNKTWLLDNDHRYHCLLRSRHFSMRTFLNICSVSICCLLVSIRIPLLEIFDQGARIHVAWLKFLFVASAAVYFP